MRVAREFAGIFLFLLFVVELFNMAQKVTAGLFKDVLLDTLREILYFPAWWYGVGLRKTAASRFGNIKSMEMRLGLKIWLKNIFKPMFGQYDIPGKIISFFMRIFQIIVRTLILIFWSVLMLGLILVWICLPLIVILGIVMNLAAL
jgi:hypothetical protein